MPRMWCSRITCRREQRLSPRFRIQDLHLHWRIPWEMSPILFDTSRGGDGVVHGDLQREFQRRGRKQHRARRRSPARRPTRQTATILLVFSTPPASANVGVTMSAAANTPAGPTGLHDHRIHARQRCAKPVAFRHVAGGKQHSLLSQQRSSALPILQWDRQATATGIVNPCGALRRDSRSRHSSI